MSPRRWAVRLARAGLALGVCALPACSVSDEEEEAYGAEVAEEVESTMPLVPDTAAARFISALGRRLAEASGRPGLEWRFTVVNTAEVNAFALPGGYVYVDRGLIETADRLDELAGVMGHEIGHVALRHSVEQLKEARKRDAAVILICTLTRACRTAGGRIALGATADAMTARHSREDEAQADSFAVSLTSRVGVDPEGLPAFFEKLLAERTEHPTLLDAFFASHPTDESRIAALQREIAALGPRSGGALLRDTPEFHAIQARLRALPPPPAPTTQ
jgi:predicted Zn-dependent protease